MTRAVSTARHGDRRRGRRPARRARTPRRSGTTSSNKRYSITEVPPDRWSIADYYDPDPAAPDKTYSKIGGWVRGFEFDWKQYHIPPRVAAAMDEGQQWAVTIAAEALADYGYPDRPLDTERTGVILGTAMGGELHYLTHAARRLPRVRARCWQACAEFGELARRRCATAILRALARGGRQRTAARSPRTRCPASWPTSSPAGWPTCSNLRGPNFITDAACASTLRRHRRSAIELLAERHCDAVITGGVDRNMGASHVRQVLQDRRALSATGTPPVRRGRRRLRDGRGRGRRSCSSAWPTPSATATGSTP